jgi:hypothetical protein
VHHCPQLFGRDGACIQIKPYIEVNNNKYKLKEVAVAVIANAIEE